jgi:hypothetical protein
MNMWAGAPDENKIIHCFSDEDHNDTSARFLAVGFAMKRAKQDRSVPLVIEITRPDDFKQEWDGYPMLYGMLTPENHRAHEIDNIERFILER